MPDKEKDDKRVRVSVVEESVLKDDEDKNHDDDDNDDNYEKSHEDHDEHDDHKEHTHHNQEKHEDVKPPNLNYPKQDKIPTWILFFSFLVGLTLGAGLIGGIFYYRSKVGSITITPTPSSNYEVQETTQPSPSVTEEKLALSKYSVQILNGSGIAGEAGRVEALLKSAGFTDTKVGNAGTYDFTDTEVSLKKDLPSSLYEEIKKDLEKYVISKSDDLEASSTYDVVITVGKSKN